MQTYNFTRLLRNISYIMPSYIKWFSAININDRYLFDINDRNPFCRPSSGVASHRRQT